MTPTHCPTCQAADGELHALMCVWRAKPKPKDMQMTIISERLAEIAAVQLQSGSHDANSQHAMCVMEAVAYVAGEPWSDAPQCACPVITAFMVSWNDGLPDADRTRLLSPLIPLLVGTRSTSAIEQRRSYMALDWLIRVHTSKWLAMVPALEEHAEALRGMEVRAMRTMGETVREGLDVRIGQSFFDTPTKGAKGYINPADFDYECAKVDAEIDEALAAKGAA